MGNVALGVCLDSGAGNYDQLWMTTSLRGLVAGTLEVRVLDEGVHSGDASGVVPSSFRILRHLLDRLEDSATGRLLPRSEEHTSELQSLMRISYAVFCLKKKTNTLPLTQSPNIQQSHPHIIQHKPT